MARLGPVEWLTGAAGAGLLVSAVLGVHPLSVVRDAFTGSGVRRFGRSTVEPSGGPHPPTFGPDPGGPTPGLVPIGQGSHRLAPAAAAAFREAERLYGRPIPVTDSYRSYSAQAAAHARDPARFVAPDRSAHVTGNAVDVNLGQLGEDGDAAGSHSGRLVAAMLAAGWCQSAWNKRSLPEPWHFSYGGCR